MIKQDYKYICTFVEEFNVVKQLECLGFDIKAKHSLCGCDEDFRVTFNGNLIISKNLTAKESIFIGNYIANTVGIDAVHPYITPSGDIMMRFIFTTVINEEYITKDNFELFKQYKWG